MGRSAVARLPDADGTPPGVRVVEHTADTGIDVDGSTLEECFARVAAGMFASFLSKRHGAERTLDLEVRAASLEELMVAWLEELLFKAEVGNLVLHTFEVTEIREGVLRARVQGRPLEEHEELVGPAVKAVTRHDLAVQRIEGRWRARVIFDI